MNKTFNTCIVLFTTVVPHIEGNTIPEDLYRCLEYGDTRSSTFAYLILNANMQGIVLHANTETIQRCLQSYKNKQDNNTTMINEAKHVAYKCRIMTKVSSTPSERRWLTANIAVYRHRISEDTDLIVAIANEVGCNFDISYHDCILIEQLPECSSLGYTMRLLGSLSRNRICIQNPGWCPIAISVYGEADISDLKYGQSANAFGLANSYGWLCSRNGKYTLAGTLHLHEYPSEGLVYVVIDKSAAHGQTTVSNDQTTNPPKKGAVVAVRLYLADDGHTPMADIKFAYGDPVTIHWANVEERDPYNSLIMAYTLWYDERPKRNFEDW